jgi:hypothetical protein
MDKPPKTQKARPPRVHFSYAIVGIIASIFLYISAWELLSALVPKEIGVKVKVYGAILAVSLLVMCWLAKQHPHLVGVYQQ